MRWHLVAVLGLALTGCASHDQAALWPGTDWQAAGLPSAPATLTADETAAPAAAGDDTPTRVPRTRTRRGSGTPPDLLFPNPATEQRPQVVQPTAPPPVAQIDTTNNVLAPRDPKAPYSAQGNGYQRSGTVIQGPNGTSNIVGSSIFGPHGSTCHAVGTSLFCN
jgi:hypothetical protein